MAPMTPRSAPRRSLAPGPDRCQAEPMSEDSERDGVKLTNLDQPLFGEAGATKRDQVAHPAAVRDRILPVLRDRPLSVIRVRPGQDPFMQKNLPRYAPEWVRT